MGSRLLQLHHVRDGGREAVPVRGFAIEVTTSGRSEAGILGGAIVLTELSPPGDPAPLFELVQSGIEGGAAELHPRAPHPLWPPADGPGGGGVQGGGFL